MAPTTSESKASIKETTTFHNLFPVPVVAVNGFQSVLFTLLPFNIIKTDVFALKSSRVPLRWVQVVHVLQSTTVFLRSAGIFWADWTVQFKIHVQYLEFIVGSKESLGFRIEWHRTICISKNQGKMSCFLCSWLYLNERSQYVTKQKMKLNLSRILGNMRPWFGSEAAFFTSTTVVWDSQLNSKSSSVISVRQEFAIKSENLFNVSLRGYASICSTSESQNSGLRLKFVSSQSDAAQGFNHVSRVVRQLRRIRGERVGAGVVTFN